MPSPTTRSNNVWETNGDDDILQIKDRRGTNLSGIDGAGAGFGALAGGGGSGLSITKVTLTSAQLLSLAETPVNFIPAPGANKVIYMMGIVAKYIPNTSVYTVNTSTNRIVINSASALALGATSPNFLTGASFIAPTGLVDGTTGATIASVIYAIPGIASLSDSGMPFTNAGCLIDETTGPGQINQPFQIQLGDITGVTPTDLSGGNGSLMIVALYQIIDLS